MRDPLVWTDRYLALGIPYPDPETMCQGYCEGVGRYPVRVTVETSPEDLRDWLAAHEDTCRNPRGGYFACDGWHFIVCRDCGGTGKRNPGSP